jgi:hypothetical protein
MEAQTYMLGNRISRSTETMDYEARIERERKAREASRRVYRRRLKLKGRFFWLPMSLVDSAG